MDDLISRQAAIAVADYSDYVGLSVDDVKRVTDEVVKGLRRLPSAQRWIPCSERLPYSQEDVLCDDDGRVTIGYYTDEEVGWHDTHSYRIYPTAWMPLPEPYERRKEKYDKEKEKT